MAVFRGFEGLVALMDRLRDPNGCPWDREQDYRSLRGYLLEECFEVAEALDAEDEPSLREELGDLLFQIVFLSRIAKERARFTIDDVVDGIIDKMVRRHPHVFGSESAESSAEVLKNWEEIKRREKGRPGTDEPPRSLLDGMPKGLPALLRAQRLGDKAARVGFDWRDATHVLDKVDEELAELKQTMARGDREAARAELGDTLFSLAMLARHLGVEPEGALEQTNLKFRRRFGWIEAELALQGRSPEQADLDELERLWGQAKSQET